MFLGHFAIGFAGKVMAPKASLGTFFLAAQLLDLLWPTFILLNLEKVDIVPGITRVTPLDFISYPFSHSLVAACLWAIAFSAIYWFIYCKPYESVVLGVAVISHWVLDFVSHRPDLQLTFHSDMRVGLGLWFSLPATLTVEMGLFLIGLILYARRTISLNRFGSYGFWSFIGFLTACYMGAVFGPPPSVTALAWSAQATWFLVAWGYWVDCHRKFVTQP